MDVGELTAGIATDRLVAVMVLGIDPAHHIEAYSTDKAAALGLLDRLPESVQKKIYGLIEKGELKEKDLPLAVCRAALKSVKK